MALTKAQLDDSGCGTPNCGHDHSLLYVHPACHPHAALDAVYVKASGTLKVNCHRCGAYVVEIEVAPGIDSAQRS